MNQSRKIFKQITNDFNGLVRFVVLNADRKLKMQSPVDSGRFRGSWRIGINGIDESVNDPDDSTIEPNPPTLPPAEEYYLTNSLPYAQRLAEGYSKQAPSGWVETIANEVTIDADKYIQRKGLG